MVRSRLTTSSSPWLFMLKADDPNADTLVFICSTNCTLFLDYRRSSLVDTPPPPYGLISAIWRCISCWTIYSIMARSIIGCPLNPLVFYLLPLGPFLSIGLIIESSGDFEPLGVCCNCSVPWGLGDLLLSRNCYCCTPVSSSPSSSLNVTLIAEEGCYSSSS